MASDPALGLGRQVAERLDKLGLVSDDAERLVRTFLSPASLRANSMLGQWMREAGLTVKEDSFGNVIGTRFGPPGTKRLVIGSHLDTVLNAGRFDGPAGVLLGIATAAALPDLPFGLEIVGFSDEEGMRFQSTYLGSRAYAGLITKEEKALRDKDGVTVEQLVQERLAAGYSDTTRGANDLLGYFEIHIEQGPVLETENLPLGVVPGIAGQTRILAEFIGKAGHAGTTPMALRMDALTASAEMALAVEQYAQTHAPLLATVGKLEVSPGVSNVIPAHVSFSLDVRSPEDTARVTAVDYFKRLCAEIAKRRGLESTWEVKQSGSATACDPEMTALLATAVAMEQARVPQLFSGAGHDAVVMSGICPTAMLFLRCRDGLSHHPDEYASPEDLTAALRAAIRFVSHLAEDHHA